jgi:DNA polymerase III alpha subunit
MQTKIGAAKAAATMRKKYGEDYHAKIGAKGGINSRGVSRNVGHKHSIATKYKISQSLKKNYQLKKGTTSENN